MPSALVRRSNRMQHRASADALGLLEAVWQSFADQRTLLRRGGG